MAFDIFSAIMAVLSILSFGAVLSDEFGYNSSTPVGTVTNPSVSNNSAETSPPVSSPTSSNVPPKVQVGSNLIAGYWDGSANVPFVVSVQFKAIVATNGKARFSGTVTSSMFGNHVFDTLATWTYLGGTSFDTVISNVHTPVTCDGKKLSFPLNPYKLGLVDNPIADQNFTIDLHRT